MENRINISIVDDNPFFNKVTSKKVDNFMKQYSREKGLDYRILTFSHVDDFMNNVSERNNIVLLDYYLGDNKTAVTVLKKMNESNIDATTAIVTQKDDAETSFLTKHYGANAFIPKDNHTFDRICYFIEKTLEEKAIH